MEGIDDGVKDGILDGFTMEDGDVVVGTAPTQLKLIGALVEIADGAMVEG